MKSDSIMEWAIRLFERFPGYAAPPRVNTYPLVDFDSSKSVIQLASLYPSSTGEYYPYFKVYSFVCDT